MLSISFENENVALNFSMAMEHFTLPLAVLVLSLRLSLQCSDRDLGARFFLEGFNQLPLQL